MQAGGDAVENSRVRPQEGQASETAGTERRSGAVPAVASEFLPGIMLSGWRLSLALMIGATATAAGADEADPAELYGDFA